MGVADVHSSQAVSPPLEGLSVYLPLLPSEFLKAVAVEKVVSSTDLVELGV